MRQRSDYQVYIFLTMVSTLITTAHAENTKVRQCPRLITQCGCTIFESGEYTVANALSATTGLTPDQGCIDIDADHVKLFTQGFAITGPGNGVGTAIHVFRHASEGFIEGKNGLGGVPIKTLITGWKNGLKSEARDLTLDFFTFNDNTVGILLSDADNNTLSNFFSDNNSIGVELRRTDNSNVNDFEANANAVFGVWVTDGSHANQIANANLNRNGIAGVFVGCSAAGPIEVPTELACEAPEKESTDNFIYDHNAFNNRGFGIALERKSERNIVTDIAATGNTRFDLFDGNVNCDKNKWRVIQFVTRNQTCINP